MIMKEYKNEHLNKGTYLNERLPKGNTVISDHSINEAEKWRNTTGLDQALFEEKLKNQGISYDHFLILLENNSSPFSKLLSWQASFEEILNVSSEYFDEKPKENTGIFVRPFILYFEKIIRKKFKIINSSLIDFEKLINSCMVALSQELKQVSDKVIVLEFYKLKDKSEITQPFTFEYYTQAYLLDFQYIQQLLNDYPIMARILTELTTRFVKNTSVLLERFIKDSEEIKSFFFQEEIQLKSVSFGHGDPHKNGQTVMVLNFENEKKLVYKPRSLDTDNSFNNFLSWINSEGLSIPLVGIPCISRKQYGWQAFVKKEECTELSMVEDYYFRMGASISIFHLLKTNDMHYENIIACGDKPYLIDLETIFSNSIYEEEVLSYPRKELLDSVLSSGALPSDQLFASNIDFDPSAIGGRINQESEKMTGWVLTTDEKNEPKYEKKNFVTSEVNHLVIYKGKTVNPADYIEHIERGFLETYKIFLKSKNNLYSKITSLFENTECRIVLRPTFMYSRFLTASQHPTHLINGATREKLLSMLWHITKFENKFKHIVDSEIECLLNNDIPYFTFKINSKSAYDSRRHKINNVFRKSSLERVNEQIKKLSISNCNEQIRLIRLSIYSNEINGVEISKLESMPASKFEKSEGMSISLLKTSEEIGDYLINQIIHSENGDYTSWLGIENIDNKALLKPLDFSLYNGMLGISIFLANLYLVTKKEIYKEVVYKNIAYIEHTMDQIEGDITNSMFNGIGSVIYSFYSFSIIFEDSTLEDLAFQYLDSLNELDKTNSKDGLGRDYSNRKIDFIDGYSGIITFLVNLYDHKKSPRILNSIENYTKELLIILKNGDSKPLLGLAHGSSGILLALRKLSHLLNFRELSLLIKELEEYEDYHFNDVLLNWPDLRENTEPLKHLDYWCHGAPGILLSRNEIENTTENKKLNKKITERLLKDVINNQQLGLCHGVFGSLDILVSLSRTYPEVFYENQIKDLAVLILSEEDSQSKLQGMKDRGLVGLMLGLSGIGYSLLRIMHPKTVPSILALELPTTRVK